MLFNCVHDKNLSKLKYKLDNRCKVKDEVFSAAKKKTVDKSKIRVEKNVGATSFANGLRVQRLRGNHTMTNADKSASLW